MQSKATTVAEYLSSLPADRREALQAVRQVFLDNLDKGYAESMQYGMIGYNVPHSLYPPGYHCDPRQPLPFGGIASQKGHMSLYLMCLYGHDLLNREFVEAWKKTGKKLDMGKACIRFKKVEDLALDVIADTIRRVTVKKYIETYQAALDTMKKPPKGKAAATTKKTTKKSAAKKKK